MHACIAMGHVTRSDSWVAAAGARTASDEADPTACRGERRAKLEAKKRLANGANSPTLGISEDFLPPEPKPKARLTPRRGGQKEGGTPRRAFKKEEPDSGGILNITAIGDISNTCNCLTANNLY